MTRMGNLPCSSMVYPAKSSAISGKIPKSTKKPMNKTEPNKMDENRIDKPIVTADKRYRSGWTLPESEFDQKDKKVFDEINRHCIKTNSLYVDPDFKADNSSLFTKMVGKVVWKRPHEICSNAQFFVDDTSRFDVRQGIIGNCWFLSALAAIADKPHIIKNIVDTSRINLIPLQSKKGNASKDYTGALKFKFWRYGRWVDIIIDDLLPTVNDRLIFLHSNEQNEFWASLLEKAYAKFHGTYESLCGGSSSEGFEDMTGGLSETFFINKETNLKQLCHQLEKFIKEKSLMSCSIKSEGGEVTLSNGLIKGHAYTITGFKTFSINSKNYNLVRIRNPWGNDKEWNGAWSDESKDWNKLNAEQKDKINFVKRDDGEFWMDYNDFVKNYDKIEVCHLNFKYDQNLAVNEFYGRWIKNVSAGGCRNYIKTFCTNPQYQVKLTDGDDDDKKGTFIISLSQIYRRKIVAGVKPVLTPIGYIIYEKKEDNTFDTYSTNFFKYNQSITTSEFTNMRTVTCRYKLKPGNYVIIPSTFEPGKECDFYLRFYTESKANIAEIEEQTNLDSAKLIKNVHDINDTSNDLKFSKKKFRNVYGDSAVVDAFKLKVLLREIVMHSSNRIKFNTSNYVNSNLGWFSMHKLTTDLCRIMICYKDNDKRGKIDIGEYEETIKMLIYFKNEFYKHDIDKSNDLDPSELKMAMKNLGFSLSHGTLTAIILRYINEDNKIDCEDFIICCFRMSILIETYKTLNVSPDSISLDKVFLQLSIYG
ncbi:hypothetical protein A3Q56_05415 [Intoshia linei]|uniref:Uncharacterized protein n=1 Tax=Intoshia linei TaxID=1819745 RepID=A0A177AYB7_9BILA|nr:hypothetical protein A3Q56_05415 [Intoshia linei]